jgi:polar amino acid transport system ATP-binding protein
MRGHAPELLSWTVGGCSSMDPPEQVLVDPVEPRTRQFLARIIEAGRL